jgi:hypothetical protein
MVRSNKYVVMALLFQRRIGRIARRNVIVRAVHCSILEEESEMSQAAGDRRLAAGAGMKSRPP